MSCGHLSTTANIFTIIGFGIALIIAVFAFAGFTWARCGAWFTREIRMRFSPLFFWSRCKFWEIRASDLLEIPSERVYKNTLNPNENVRVEPVGSLGKYFKLIAPVKKKLECWICDWKGRRFNLTEYVLRDLWLQVRPFSYRLAGEWKVGISVLHSDAPLPEEYEHRQYGEKQILYEISTHHEEGKQGILWVFAGDPIKIKSDKINGKDWTWLRIKIDKGWLEFFAGFESLEKLGKDYKSEVSQFEPNEVWLTFWADEPTDMAVGFRRIKTYWHKKDNK